MKKRKPTSFHSTPNPIPRDDNSQGQLSYPSNFLFLFHIQYVMEIYFFFLTHKWNIVPCSVTCFFFLLSSISWISLNVTTYMSVLLVAA